MAILYKPKSFEDYLSDRHADQYAGLDDEMGEDFCEWMEQLDGDEWLEYGEKYGNLLDMKACLCGSKAAQDDCCEFTEQCDCNDEGCPSSGLTSETGHVEECPCAFCHRKMGKL